MSNNESGTIRPARFNSFIGQVKAIQQLTVAVKAAKARKLPLGHILLLGPAGLGKTTLGCSVVPTEFGAGKATYVNCSAVEKTTDLLPILTTQKAGSILFMDEIHALIPAAREFMLSLLEDSRITVPLGDDKSDLMTVDLPKYTVIAATTRPAALSDPMRDRFMHIVQLEPYSVTETAEIIQWHAEMRSMACDLSTVEKLLAPVCRGTARHAVRLVEACTDTCFADYDGIETKIGENIITATLKRLGYASNLTPQEIALLRALHGAKDNRLGLNTLGAQLHEDPQTVEIIIEPWLLQNGYITRELKGRVLTDSGKALYASIS